MKKNQLTMLVLFVTMLGFTACSDDDKMSISTVGITTTVDTTIEGLQLTGGTYTFECKYICQDRHYLSGSEY
mgnify:CR=1 FL=1